jgi:glycosyltransferase involved in cell wall biosynthesis
VTVAILVPVLNRPHRVQPLLDSIAAATPVPHRVLFITDPGDRAECDAIGNARAAMLATGGNYAQKIRHGVAATTDPYIFTGADDLDFQPGWFEAAAAQMTGPVQVVGVNDLIPRRRGRQGHATHFLMSRTYALCPTIDGEPGPFSTAYAHNFVDDELIATAKKRGVYAYADDAHVRHEHPMAGGPDDDTYRKGRARFRDDRHRFFSRRPMWT